MRNAIFSVMLRSGACQKRFSFHFSIAISILCLFITTGYAATQVSQHGVSWYFSQDAQVGQFVNGDWWVIGPVTVSSVSPAPTSSRNGSVINPQADYPAQQGYDSNISAYDASLRVNYPLNLNPGDSLVSSVSWETSGTHVDLIGRNVTVSNHNLRTAAVLTCLAQTPPADAFRPPYAGSNKPIYTKSQIQYQRLPRLTPPQKQINPNYDYDDVDAGLIGRDYSKTIEQQFGRYFQRPWILHVQDWQGRASHPTDNMPNYHANVYETIVEGAVLLMADLDDIDTLLIPFLQLGIDSHYISHSGDKTADSSIHKWPIVFAGVMFDDAAMKSNSYNFRTDWMTYYANAGTSSINSSIVPSGQGWTGTTALYRQDPGDMEHEHLDPTEWDQVPSGGGIKREKYRRINSPAWVGIALSARLTNAMEAWNHPAFFDYVDRWMTEPDAANKTYLEQLWNNGYSIGSTGGGTSSTFITKMWDEYRGIEVPPPPPPEDDEVPPLGPLNLTSPQQTDHSIALSWTAPGAASDGDVPTAYRIYRDGAQVAQVSSTSYTDSSLASETTYAYQVFSVDNVGNVSLTDTNGSFTTTEGTFSSSGVWENQALATQSDSFTIEFDATPMAATIDGVTGFSNGIADAYSDLALTIRFFTNGLIDARNGDTYMAQSALPYQANVNYHFRLEVDLAQHTYSIYVTPQGSVEQVVGLNYAFRNTQSSVNQLNTIALAPGGPHFVDNIQLTPVGGSSNQAPILNAIGSQTVTENSTLNFTVSATDPDNDPIIYSALNLPIGATFNSQTFNWTPGSSQAGSYQVTFTAYDGQASDSEQITITVNAAPISGPEIASFTLINADSDQPVFGYDPLTNNSQINLADIGTNNLSIRANVAGGTAGSVKFALNSIDPYHIENAAPYALQGDNSGDYHPWNPGTGSHTISATAYSGANATGSSGSALSISIDIINSGGSSNQAPVLNSIGNKTVNENSDLIFSVSATDGDGDALTYNAVNLPAGAQFANQAFTWRPTYDQAGDNYQVTFIVSDGTDQTPETINITVFNVNRPPTLTSISDQQASINSPVIFAITANDPDGDPIIYSAQDLPTGATFTNQTFSWTPDSTASELNTITFYATDGQDQDYLTITIIVGSDNEPPVLAPVGDQEINELTPLSISLLASDPDGDPLSYSANTMPVGATLEDNLFSWTPTYGQAGIYQVTFIVSDNELVDFETIIITVNNVNQAPVLELISPVAEMEDTPISFVVSATDADGDTLSYSVEGLNLLVGATFENQTFDWRPGYDDAGTYELTFNATDGVDTDSQTITVAILNNNRLPVFSPIGDRNIETGQTLAFVISATDADGDQITYSVDTLPSPQAFLTPTEPTATFSWQPLPDETGAYSVSFIATDGHDFTTETITITVHQGNVAPTITQIDTQTVQENSDISFTISATDENNDPLTYSVQNLPAGATFVGQLFSWSPDFNAAGEYPITFVVSDGILETMMVVSVIIQNTNRVPQWQPLNDIFINDTETIHLDLAASDPDGDTLTYSILGSLPGSAQLNANSFDWALQMGDAGTYQVIFVASDGDLDATTTLNITIHHEDQPPIINVAANHFVNQYSTLTFPISATDPENDPVQITVVNLPTGATFTTNSFSWTPDTGQDGSTQITIEATDGNLVSTATVTIFVMAVTLDSTEPFVSYTSPGNEAIQVPLNTLLVMEVADSGDGVDANSVVIKADGQDIYKGNVSEYNSGLGKAYRYGNQALYKYTFQPDPIYRNDQTVALSISARDLAGNVMAPHTFSFSTEMMTFGGITPVNLANDGQTQNHPASARDNAGNLWSAWQSGPSGAGRIITTRLLNGSDTFENSVQQTAQGDQAHPTIAVDSDGTAYLCWQENIEGVWKIKASVSNNGINWTTPKVLVESEEDQTHPVVTVDPLTAGTVYVAYQQQTGGIQDIHLAASSSALSAITHASVTNHSSQQIDPDLVVADGVVYIVWTDLRHPTTSIYGASSANGWINTAIVNQASNQSQPALAAESSGNRLHLAWTDDQPGHPDIFFTVSNGFNDAPLSGINLIDDTTSRIQSTPDLIVKGFAASVRVFVGWQDERNSPSDSDIYFTEVTTSSRTNILVTVDTSNSTQSAPTVGLNAAGDPYLLWVDDRGSDEDIYYGGATNIAGVQMAAADITQADGGVVGTPLNEINDTDDVSAEIPAGALWSDVTLTISKISNPTQTSDVTTILSAYEFSPSSELEFAKPVTLTIPYEVANNHAADVYWYNSLTGQLSQVGLSSIEIIEIGPNLRAIRFKTTHFSQYVIGEQITTKARGKGLDKKSKK